MLPVQQLSSLLLRLLLILYLYLTTTMASLTIDQKVDLLIPPPPLPNLADAFLCPLPNLTYINWKSSWKMEIWIIWGVYLIHGTYNFILFFISQGTTFVLNFLVELFKITVMIKEWVKNNFISTDNKPRKRSEVECSFST